MLLPLVQTTGAQKVQIHFHIHYVIASVPRARRVVCVCLPARG